MKFKCIVMNMSLSLMLISKINSAASIAVTGEPISEKELFKAIEAGNKDKVSFLLDKGINVNASDGLNNTALENAVDKGNIKLTKLLIDSKADVNSNPRHANLSLDYAAGNGRVEIARLLIEAGANVNSSWNKGLNGEPGRTPLMSSVRQEGNLEIIQMLLNNGANIDAVEWHCGHTPLIWASRDGVVESVKILLEHGADFEHRNNENKKAIDVALTEEGGVTYFERIDKKAFDDALKDADEDTISYMNKCKLEEHVQRKKRMEIAALLEKESSRRERAVSDYQKELCKIMANKIGNMPYDIIRFIMQFNSINYKDLVALKEDDFIKIKT